jgi:hypothetical protein
MTTNTTDEFDAVELEILRTQLESVAEEMGSVLVRGAYSPNITERRDCSTALFDRNGRMLAQAEHIPVHLGAMPEAVGAVLDCDPRPGDAFLLNDPFRGGTHLPDVTRLTDYLRGRYRRLRGVAGTPRRRRRRDTGEYAGRGAGDTRGGGPDTAGPVRRG